MINRLIKQVGNFLLLFCAASCTNNQQQGDHNKIYSITDSLNIVKFQISLPDTIKLGIYQEYSTDSVFKIKYTFRDGDLNNIKYYMLTQDDYYTIQSYVGINKNRIDIDSTELYYLFEKNNKNYLGLYSNYMDYFFIINNSDTIMSKDKILVLPETIMTKGEVRCTSVKSRKIFDSLGVEHLYEIFSPSTLQLDLLKRLKYRGS